MAKINYSVSSSCPKTLENLRLGPKLIAGNKPPTMFPQKGLVKLNIKAGSLFLRQMNELFIRASNGKHFPVVLNIYKFEIMHYKIINNISV